MCDSSVISVVKETVYKKLSFFSFIDQTSYNETIQAIMGSMPGQSIVIAWACRSAGGEPLDLVGKMKFHSLARRKITGLPSLLSESSQMTSY